MSGPTKRCIALVTGATRGIGRETARLLAEEGWHVLVGHRDPSHGRALERSLSHNGSVEALPIDVTNDDSVATAAAVVTARHGRLDLLVNNAGRFIGASARETTPEQVAELLAVNVVGVVRVTRAFLPLLAAATHARVVNVSSRTASLALTAAGAELPGDSDLRLAYTVSKAALNMLTLQYARAFAGDDELRHVTIVSVSPGYAATDMNGHRASRSAAEAGRTIVAAATRQDFGGRFLGDDEPIPW